MGLIADLNPINYQAEKSRFLADPTFDPQFEYVREFSEEELCQKGFPTEKYQAIAQQVLTAATDAFTPEEIEGRRGELLTQEKVTTALQDFLGIHQLDTKFSLSWSENYVSRASVTDNNIIKLRLPCTIRKEDLLGLIYHEIGTHALRRINYQQQPWYKKKKKFGFSPYIKTEEGLATLHALLTQERPFALRAAINYLAVHKAQESSFLEVWHFVRRYIANEERAFSITFKKKRGLKDTQRPGGFTKDLVYFEGLVDVARFLIENNFPLRELYFGKISWQDIDRAVELNPDFEPVLPIFYAQDPEQYQQKVREIAQVNFLV